MRLGDGFTGGMMACQLVCAYERGRSGHGAVIWRRTAENAPSAPTRSEAVTTEPSSSSISTRSRFSLYLFTRAPQRSQELSPETSQSLVVYFV